MVESGGETVLLAIAAVENEAVLSLDCTASDAFYKRTFTEGDTISGGMMMSEARCAVHFL